MNYHQQRQTGKAEAQLITRKTKNLVIFYGILGAINVICGIMGENAIAQTAPIPAADNTGTVVNQTGNTYNITGGQRSGDGANLFHSFQEFGLNAGQTANFLSSPEINNILGRVTGGNASIINGLIQVTGGNSNLFLMNPAGIIFGPNASLNVLGDFTATTSTNIGFNSEAFNAFGSNNYSALVGEPSTFAFSLSQPGAILNEGNLSLNPEQKLTLLGGTVVNLGTLSSPGGNITIAAVPGENLVRINQENHLLSLEIPTSPTGNNSPNQPPQNFQPLDLPSLLTGGHITHASNVTVNNDGTISLTGSTLRIPTDPGVTVASGNIDVSNTSTNGNGTGGAIAVLGDKVALVDALINASGIDDGGVVLVGGEYRGEGEVPNASETFVSKDTLISVDSLENGDGGQVIIWADETTRFHGEISAKGGSQNGNGGFVEVSGKQDLIFRGQVDTSAPQGSTGTLLLDPDNITIVDGSGAPNDNQLNAGEPFGDPEGVIFDDTLTAGANYTISETALEAIGANSSIILEAADNITIEDLSDNTLSLQMGAAGSVSLIADADFNGVGDFTMNPADAIVTQGGDITISAGNSSRTGNQINLGNITTNGGNFIAETGSNSTITVNGNIDAGIGFIDLRRAGRANSPPTVQFGNYVTLTANDINLDTNTISTTQTGLDLVIQQGDSNQGIHINNSTGCSPGFLCLDSNSSGNSEFNLLQNAGFNSITIGRTDATNFIEISGNAPSLTLSTTTIIQGGTGSIEINAPLIVGNNALTLTADEININNVGSISGTGSLTLQPTTVGQNISLGGSGGTGVGILYLTESELANIQNGFNSITIGRADGTGAITIDGPTSGLGFSDPVTIQSPGGSITNNFQILGNDNASVTLIGPTTLNADITTNNQNIGIIGNTTLGADATLNSGSGTIDFQGTIDGSYNLTLNAGTGNVNIGGAVGNNTRLNSLNILGQNTSINGNVTTLGTQEYNGNVTFVNSNPQITAGELNINGTISGNGSLLVQPIIDNSPIEIGGINQSPGLNLTEAELQSISGFNGVTIGSTGGTGALNIASPVNLSNQTFDLTLQGGAVSFNDGITLGNNRTLTLNTGSITSPFTGTDIRIAANGTVVLNTSGSVGDSLNSLETNVSQININNVTGNLFVNNGQTLSLGTANISGNLEITANGNITGNSPIAIGGNSTFTTTAIGADITLSQLATPGIITVNTNGAGADANITSANAVNLGSSTVGGSLNVTANNGDISTEIVEAGTDITLTGNSISLNNNLTSGGLLNVTANNGDISTEIVEAGTDITLTGNSISLNNNLTSGGLLNVTANNGGISTTGAINAASNITFTGDTIALNNTLTSPGNLILQPFNQNTPIEIGGETGTFNISLAEIANLSNGFSSITIGRSDGTGMVNLGAISFSDPVTIQSGTGQVTVNGTITAIDNATVNFNTSNLFLNAGISTNNQTIAIAGDMILNNDLTLDTGAGAGDIIFTGTINGNRTLTLNAGTGRVSFGGILGNLTPLNRLTVTGLINSGLQATADTIELNGDINSAGASVILTGNNQLITNNVNITTSGGLISLTNPVGDVTVGNLDSSNPNGTGGAIAVNSPNGVVTTGNLTSTGITGGDITVQALTSITTEDIDSSGTVGNGGNVLLDPEDFIDVGFINAQGGLRGSGGNVEIVTGGVFRANNTFTDQNGQVASISTAGAGGSGNVSLSHNGGSQNTPFVVGDPTTNGTAGVITTGANNTIPLGSSFPGPLEQGNIRVITAEPETPVEEPPVEEPPAEEPPVVEEPAVDETPVAPASGDDMPLSLELDPEPDGGAEEPGSGGAEEIAATPEVAPEAIAATPEVAPEPIAATPEVAPEPIAATPEVAPEPIAATPEVAPITLEPISVELEPEKNSPISVPISERVQPEPRSILPPEKVGAIATELDSPSETEEEEEENVRQITPENLASPQEVAIVDPGVAEIENSFTQAFSDHIGESKQVNVSLPQAQNIIRNIEGETGVKPALLYVYFAPTSLAGNTDNDPLELILVTADGRPVRKVLPVTRREVMDNADNLITYITAPRYRRQTKYLEPAQNLYQWLIAPLTEELDAKEIQNIAFIMDVGLRTLPIAALHDGESFLVQKYSVGMMPSLSLTDTRYQNIQNASVLAMGASEFTNLNPLPAVPAEMKIITQEIRQGASFLNQDFTLQNIQKQHAEKQYPIVHLATHGEFNPGDLSNSYIQLWDQKLGLNDIRQLGLHDPAVDLLVLSACQTAVGNEEAELGFAGLAVQAGVKTAIASLWYVSDEGTFGLMTEFYKQLGIAPIKAEAMRQAQLSMINGNVEIEGGQLRGSRGTYTLPESLQSAENQKLTHPYYWAAFTLIGSPW
ncbi:CHAT domain-containing protein [Planktothricoides sp. FACHB-1370]|uniref:CHAT domain-containing protein n=2 Tax=Planktothricoides raciborskii TaxID=132608 RepID=A0ABR8EBN0_9CYAN|nr:CHAT domain-containing protein [Planktothricoides raciborskii]MBD2544249.1 CHAT domain-containing protein [Planktothricoides raciborskii FACHB-1370]MBD2583601.1 CHAT domain-containing protein [Planktothricoides raciborskii FACHB-1261]